MKILPIESIPKPDERVDDWLFFHHRSNGVASSYFIYASARDFLSTPAAYSVVEFFPVEVGDTNFYQDFVENYCQQMTEIHGEVFSELPFDSGFYEISEGEFPAYLFVCNDKVVEIEASKFELQQTIYHCDTAKAALSQLLSNSFKSE